MNILIALTPLSREPAKVKAFAADVDRSSVAIEGSVYIFGGVLAVMRWRRVLRAAGTVWPLLALGALAFLSITWSVEPMVTLRRSVSLLAATVVAVYLGERYSINGFARLLAQTLIVMIILVLVLYLFAPEYVIDYSAYGGAWRGLSAYKNTFGDHMAIAVLLLVLVKFHRFNWIRYLFLLIAAGLLLLSRSANAVVCGVLSLAAIPLWHLMRSERRLLVYPLAALILLLGTYCVLAFPEPLFQILGRDATLTGRTQLWAILLPVIANRPILGYGYAAFWAGLKPEVLTVWIAAGRLVPVADNGYIDLALSLGAVGVCVLLYVFVQAFRRAIEYLKSEPGSIGLWPITYFCMFAVYNICESTLLTTGTFPFLVFAILATSVAVNQKRELASARTVGNQPFIEESLLLRSRAGTWVNRDLLSQLFTAPVTHLGRGR
jgi:O-antigen ligase